MRAIEASDISSLVELVQRAMPHSWDAATFMDCLKPEYHTQLILEKNKIVGFIILLVRAGECEIMNIAVDPDFQGQGLGWQLMQHAFTFCRENNLTQMHLEVRASNVNAIQFYERCGFQKVGERKNYYPCGDGREDAVLFSFSV